jgi:hypothetical protein
MRARVESKLFNKAYDNSDPIEKPKYGVFNIFNDPKGVSLCHFFGKSFFVLKKVRLRTTFTFKDSFGIYDSKKELSTCQHFAHILN